MMMEGICESDSLCLLLQSGEMLLGLRRDAQGLECFKQALALAPREYRAVIGQSRALMRLGSADAALALLNQWPLDETERFKLEGIRAQVFYAKGCAEEAWSISTHALMRDPQDAWAHLIRGLLLYERGDSTAALLAFDLALAADLELAAAHQARGSALLSLGRADDALAGFEAARCLDPNNAGLSVQIGHLMIRMNRFDTALEAFEAALIHQPRNASALQGQAQCLAVLNRAPEAVEAYSHLLDVAPDADYMRGERFHLQMHCCEWRDYEAARQDIAARVRRGERADVPGSFMAHSDSSEDQKHCAQIFAADFCPRAVTGTPDRSRRRSERIRVAYLSADFHAHATSFLAAGLFEAHDRCRFETHAISFGPEDNGPMRQRLIQAFDRFDDVRQSTDDQVAALLREREIDIAVDLKGHTLGARPWILASRPASLQVSFLGYPGTLGIDFLDYIVADRTVIPETERVHYTEQVIYLQGSYQVNSSARLASAPATRRSAGLPDEAFVFCCFNNSYKITPDVFDDWMEILRAVSGSVLWLLEGNAAAVQNLRAEAERRGIDARRLVFARLIPQSDHLARCGLADLFLDTAPYNAHTTASDALWSGVPLITRPGATFASRVATSLLRALNLDELSVNTRNAYRRAAIRLARAPDELKRMKAVLSRARESSALFDSAAYCRQLERAFEVIMERHGRGERPSSLEL